MEIDEPVFLEKYTPQWAARFRAERARVRAALQGFGVQVEHIGSTAVAGMTAKPIVDILCGVGSYPPSDALTEAVTRLGYECHGECGVCGRVYFTRRSGAERFNLHICLFEGQIWNDNLLLRDHLRTHPEQAAAYSALKETIVSRGEIRLIEYSAQKGDLISSMLRAARQNGTDT